MMESSLSPMRLEFARRAEMRRDDERRAFERDNKIRKGKKERDEKDEREDALQDAAVVILASSSDVAEFTVTLDRYDAATVEALQLNEQRLADIRQELELRLGKAYVLPDGRRVFKTEDGLRVFDEHGVEVEDFNPDKIEDWRPDWESYSAGRETEEALTQEREGLIEYQKQIDDARSRIDADEPLTQADLDDLETRLEEAKPDAVKRVLGEPIDEPTIESEAAFDPASLMPAKIAPPVLD